MQQRGDDGLGIQMPAGQARRDGQRMGNVWLTADAVLPLVGRGTESVLARYMGGGFSAFTNYPVVLFVSRFGQYRSSAIMTTAILVILGVVFVRMLSREDVWKLDGYVDLPSLADSRGHALDPRNYADQRGGHLSLRPRPYIQSEVIAGDYVRLFVPYNASRDSDAMAKLCEKPPTADVADRDAASNAWLECAARLYALSIDDKDLKAPRFDLATEPELGLRGFVAMLDVSDLARGRHVLEVVRVKVESSDATEDAAEATRPSAQPIRIVFWR